MPNLLIEIGTEEIPAGYVEPALHDIAKLIADGLADARLSCDGVETAATPRRLAAFARNVSERQPDINEEVQGPPAKVAFDADGNPTKAAVGFAKKLGVDPSAIEMRETARGNYAFARRLVPGEAAVTVLREMLPGIIAGVRFPKSMRWVAGGITFARPFRTLLALLGDEIVKFEINGVRSGRVTKGHPFLSPGDIQIATADFDAYRKALAGRHVIVNIDERRERIRARINAALSEYGSKLDNGPLLNEVTHLVEWPNIVVGGFDESYLKLPDEVTIAAMAEHQRYFDVHDADGNLLPKFISVSNRLDEHAGTVRQGNERVLAARLSDAEFFWQEDSATPLSSKIGLLEGVVFQEKLGTYLDKAGRMVELAKYIGKAMGLDTKVCAECAQLAKADLVTQMVKEFPKLQGIMGREYAANDGCDAEVATGIAEHYQPRGAGDSTPATAVGACVALADKLDSLVGCFCAGLAPTGNRDPYALRRHALGIIRIILETDHDIQMDIAAAIAFSKGLLPDGIEEADGAVDRILTFVADRLRVYMLGKGCRYDLFDAVLATGLGDLRDFRSRLDQLQRIAEEPGWEELVTVVQRTANILKKVSPEGEVDARLLEEPQEKAVVELLAANREEVLVLAAQGKYIEASRVYAEAFVGPVHEFFDKVFVNVDDADVKNNRQLLMKSVNELYAQNIADLSKVVMAEKSE